MKVKSRAEPINNINKTQRNSRLRFNAFLNQRNRDSILSCQH